MTTGEWKTLGTFHQVYAAGDPVGYAMAWLGLLPFAGVGFLCCGVYFRRELSFLVAVLGAALSEAVNVVLKNSVFREPRPSGSVRSGFGMPSAHCQLLGFLLCWAFLRIAVTTPSLRFRRLTSSQKSQLSSFSILVALSALSRWYLPYHSLAQVIVGVIVGALLAGLWFLIDVFVLQPHVYNVVLHWKVIRRLGISK